MLMLNLFKPFFITLSCIIERMRFAISEQDAARRLGVPMGTLRHATASGIIVISRSADGVPYLRRADIEELAERGCLVRSIASQEIFKELCIAERASDRRIATLRAELRTAQWLALQALGTCLALLDTKKPLTDERRRELIAGIWGDPMKPASYDA